MRCTGLSFTRGSTSLGRRCKVTFLGTAKLVNGCAVSTRLASRFIGMVTTACSLGVMTMSTPSLLPKNLLKLALKLFRAWTSRRASQGGDGKLGSSKLTALAFFFPFLQLSPVLSLQFSPVYLFNGDFSNLLLKVGGAANFQEQVQKVARHSDVGRCG